MLYGLILGPSGHRNSPILRQAQDEGVLWGLVLMALTLSVSKGEGHRAVPPTLTTQSS